MLFWIVLTIIITPWFRSLSMPQNIPTIDFKQDRIEVRSLVEWERGKIKPSPINSIFSNWPEEMFHQRLAIVMENIDIGNYFFSGHPRERVGVEEKQKFTLFQFVLFLVGFTNKRIKKYKKFLLFYIGISLLIVFILKLRTFEESMFLSVPFILIISLGMEKLFITIKQFLLKMKGDSR